MNNRNDEYSVRGDVHMDKLSSELISLIDENLSLRNRISELERDYREVNNTQKHEPVSVQMYKTFMEIEDVRVTYGFTPEEIIRLEEEAKRRNISLKRICSEAVENYQPSFTYEPECNLHDLYYHLEYEMDHGEAFNCYYGDDDPYDNSEDIFAPTEEDLYEYKSDYYERHGYNELWEEEMECNPYDGLDGDILEALHESYLEKRKPKADFNPNKKQDDDDDIFF